MQTGSYPVRQAPIPLDRTRHSPKMGGQYARENAADFRMLGENLAYTGAEGHMSPFPGLSPEAVTKAWYDEIGFTLAGEGCDGK